MDVPDRRADCILPPLPPPTDIPARSADHVPPPLPSSDLAWEWGEPTEISGLSFNARAFQPRSSLHWRFGSRRSRLDEQPELPHRRRFTSTIEYDNAGASTDPEIGTNLHPLNAGYTSLVPKGIASDRLVCQLLRSGLINQPPPLQNDGALACQVQTLEP
jgi:hypothetical protein